MRFAILLLTVLSTAGAAQTVHIARAHRVPNLPQGYCGQAVLETAGQHLGHRSLYGYRDHDFRARRGGPGGTYPHNLIEAVRQRGLGVTARPHGNRGFVGRSLARGLPVIAHYSVVSPGNHWVLVTHQNERRTCFYDPNVPGRSICHSRQEFHRRWTGYAIRVER